jgi:hypothetical protein
VEIMSGERDSMTDIRYEWIPVEVGEGVPFELSGDVALSVGKLPQRPAIYRWGFFKESVLRKASIGETENLKRRVRGYISPGPSQETNKRINAEFEKASRACLKVRLDVLRIQTIHVNRVIICNGNLTDPFVRKMMENFILADFDVVHCGF